MSHACICCGNFDDKYILNVTTMYVIRHSFHSHFGHRKCRFWESSINLLLMNFSGFFLFRISSCWKHAQNTPENVAPHILVLWRLNLRHILRSYHRNMISIKKERASLYIIHVNTCFNLIFQYKLIEWHWLKNENNKSRKIHVNSPPHTPRATHILTQTIHIAGNAGGAMYGTT